jgi:signal transduction histidine kinase
VVGLLGLGLSIAAVAQLRREGQLSRLRSDFVTAVSHELRTPLAQIRLFLDTLRLRRYDTDAQRDWLLGHLVRETTRLEHLVENVLAISRLERGATPAILREPADLSQEVRDAVVAFEPLAASRRAGLITRVEPGVLVGVEREALRQLLLNLFDNAVKFGPPGQQIEVTVRDHDCQVELTVKDQGPGVAAAEREQIWEPYYRGRGESVRAVGGSGIGLAIARDIATRAGGTSEVRSPPEGGAEFVIRLPRLQGQDGP